MRAPIKSREAQPCPRAGGGVHSWLQSEANRCRWRGLTPDQAAQRLREVTRDCGRTVPSREIVASVQTAWRGGLPAQPHKFTMQPSPPTWPEADAKRIAELTADGRGLADLWEASPVRFDSNAPRAEELIATLFPGNPLLCIGDPCILPDGSPSQTFDTKPHEAWRGDIARHSLIVPSPMSNVWGRRKSDGKPSKHTLDNTGPRRFLVIEFDNGSLDSQASRIFHLASKAPLALVTHSGSKSLHSWFYCQGQAENSLHRFMRYAVTIGADKATWLRSQFVRVPDGTRDDGRAQRAYFFNPQVIKA